MRKRIVMFITTLALSTMMLAGCGDKNKTNNSVTSSATEEPDGDATEGPVVMLLMTQPTLLTMLQEIRELTDRQTMQDSQQ